MKSQATDIVKSCVLSDMAGELGVDVSPAMVGVAVTGVKADSRGIVPGNLFVALEGERFDGHNYLQAVAEKGCAAVVVQTGKAFMADGIDVPVIEVGDTRSAFAVLASAFYGHPERQLVMTGITGTNGKTTTCYILESIIKSAGYSPGVIGTVSYRYHGFEKQAALTTPEPDELFKMFSDMVVNGVTHLLMEVSSHSVIQRRLSGISYDVAVFTNLTRDHLDFHGDMEEYFHAKKLLFTEYLKNQGVAVILDQTGKKLPDEVDWGARLADELLRTGNFSSRDDTGQKLLKCGADGAVMLSDYKMDLSGIRANLICPTGKARFRTTLTGGFNLENILAAAGAAVALGFSVEQICKGISRTGQVPGRLEKVGSGDLAVFVDYAHTPDALANAIRALKSLGNNRLIVLFGCGGDRDRGKRKLMGEVAAQLAEVVVITSDNPRSEKPMDIIREIEQGVINARGVCLKKNEASHILKSGLKGYDIIESRKEAIEVVIAHCKTNDVVLISGKGHEDYQIIGENKIHFDDRQEALRSIAERNCREGALER